MCESSGNGFPMVFSLANHEFIWKWPLIGFCQKLCYYNVFLFPHSTRITNLIMQQKSKLSIILIWRSLLAIYKQCNDKTFNIFYWAYVHCCYFIHLSIVNTNIEKVLFLYTFVCFSDKQTEDNHLSPVTFVCCCLPVP